MGMSRTSQGYVEIAAAAESLTTEGILSIDPSIGSQSSMPGWAYFNAGELISSGRILVPLHFPTPKKLRYIRQAIQVYCNDLGIGTLVYEKVPVSAHAGRSQVAHASLLMATGAILSGADVRHTVGIHPSSWKKLARPEYQKGDEQDAIELGWVAVQEAKGILQDRVLKANKKAGKKSA